MRTCLLGLDIGSSSVKASVMDAFTGKCLASAQSPTTELEIMEPVPGWAEQHPETWWWHVKKTVSEILEKSGIRPDEIRAVGISYQMHGLVCVNNQREVIRNAIIWCDGRAVELGERAFQEIGNDRCLSHLHNSPGNFTASKLRWIIENEPSSASKIRHFMLPGDFIAMKLTGEINTTITGLSEMMLWDFRERKVAGFLLDHYGIDHSWVPSAVMTFGIQGKISAAAAAETGLPKGIPVSYRAGDQPNNAFSLNVLQPGEIASTAGTSGVVYGVSGKNSYDPESRVNTFVHVNDSEDQPRNGILLCINGAGIMNSWIRKLTGGSHTYEEMNRINVRSTANTGRS